MAIDPSEERPLIQVGRSVRASDWEARTSGTSVYASDVELPGMLVGAVVRSPHPFALVESIDVTEAEQLPGVHAVVVGSDLPRGAKYVHHGGEHSDRQPIAVDVVRFIGQEVAAVAADDRTTADKAAQLIRVGYKPMPGPTTMHESLLDGSAQLHRRSVGPNVAAETIIDWGDTDKAFAKSSRISEGRYIHPRVTHLTMEPDVTVAWWREPEDRLHIWTSTQSPFYVTKELAHVLELDPDQIEFHAVAVGGGFGARSKITDHEVIASLLSMASNRPVKVMLTREEQFATTKTRHEFDIRIRLAADDAHMLTGIEADVLVNNGAYSHTGPSVMATGLRLLGNLYQPSGVRARGRLIDTATVPGGQFRGYGGPQMIFALESEVDELAASAGLDPLEFRILNANGDAEETLSGARITEPRLADCLRVAREAIGWEQKKGKDLPGHGLGVAVSVHGSGVFAYEGANQSTARVEIDTEGRVRVGFGGADAGTGQRTILAQLVAEELGVQTEDVQVDMMDTSFSPVDQGAWSSRGTYFGGGAALQAARSARDRLVHAGQEKFGTPDVWLEGGSVRCESDDLPMGDLVASMPDLEDGRLISQETFEDPTIDPTKKFASVGRAHPSPSYAFAVHAVEVSVDVGTGQIEVLDYVAVHDIGRAINPIQVESQIIGGVVMGLGATLREEMVLEQGRLVNPSYMQYGVPRAPDAPNVRVILLEEEGSAGPYGAKNVGELSIMPVAAAVANAVRDATGIRIRQLPLTPDKIVVSSLPPRNLRSLILFRPSRWWISFIRWLYPRGLLYALHRWGTKFAHRRPTGNSIVEVRRPSSTEELLDLASNDYVPVGGATELQLLRRQRLSNAARLVVVGSVPPLKAITRDDDGSLVIGGAATLASLELAGEDIPPILKEAVRSIASPQIRAMATVAGNLLQEKRCGYYRNGFDCYKRGGPTCPCYAVLGDHRFYHAAVGAHRCQAVTPSDLATALIALRAEAVLMRGTDRTTIAVSDLYRGPGESCLMAGDILANVVISQTSLAKIGAFEKLNLWSGDFAIASVAIAARIDSSRWHDVTMCIGGLTPEPWQPKATCRRIAGTVITAADLRRSLTNELRKNSHPLEHNAWKIHSAAALAERAAIRMIEDNLTRFEPPHN